MNILVGIGMFIATLFLIDGGYYFVNQWRVSERRTVRHRLNSIPVDGSEMETAGIERQSLFSAVPWLNRLLGRFPLFRKMNIFLEQAGTGRFLGFYILLSLLLLTGGYLAASLAFRNPLVCLAAAIVPACLPFLTVSLKRARRMEKFQRQLPEAMELMARALKAGHAFSGALKMVANEMDDPIGLEFERTLNEINLGVEVAEALKNLSRRVDCENIRFFVVSVIIQRETGGNLAEILENIAYLVRERFKLQGKIRVLSAEGKLSAIILIALPFLIALAIYFSNPDYILTLTTDPIGNIMIAAALGFLTIGIFTMRKMVKIEV